MSLTLEFSNQRLSPTKKQMDLASLLMSRTKKAMISALGISLTKKLRRKEKKRKIRTVMDLETLETSKKFRIMMTILLLTHPR